MPCDPLAVTRFVDGELPSAGRTAVSRHLAECPACAGQAAFETEAGDLLRSLPPLALPAGLAERVRTLALGPRVSAN
jgi:anti-sigma factor RsiW